jgi:galactoside O-acetyltransferase
MIGYHTEEELKNLGFGSLGSNVKISKTATLYNCNRIFLGSNVRIDNFCVLAISGNASLSIGNNVQISAFSFMNGMGCIRLEDFSTLAPYVRIFSSTDDYSGEHLTGATIPKEFLGTFSADVVIGKHAIIGTGSTIMPGVALGMGTAVGAHSFVNRNSDPFTVIAGVPAKLVKKRSDTLIELERKFLGLQ